MDCDYAIIGSGVAGATIAKVILERRPEAKVVVLEAGSRVVLKDRRKWWDFVSTGINPYVDHHDLPLDEENHSAGSTDWIFRGSRLMGLGGSTVHWGGWCLRFKPEDFHLCTNTGRGADWPFGYEELAPYYQKAEAYLSVSGTGSNASGDEVRPAFPYVAADGPMIRAFRRLGIAYGPMPMARYRKCMTTGTCRYCPFGSRFTAAFILEDLMAANANLTVLHNSPVKRLLTASKQKVAAAEYINTQNGRTDQVRATTFVICSGAIESPKLLLQSTSAEWEAGIGNDNDLVGRFLISHPFLHVRYSIPTNSLRWLQELDFPTLMSRHFDSPDQQSHGKLFLFKDRSRPHVDLADLMIQGKSRAAIDRVLSDSMDMELQGFTEEFGNYGNRVELAPGENRMGLPQTKVTFARNLDFEQRVETRLQIMKDIIHEMGIVPDFVKFAKVRTQRGDHAASTCRMGRTPEEGVVDAHLRVHGTDNLFVCSNAVFPSGAAVNPTLTLTALAFRLGASL